MYWQYSTPMRRVDPYPDVAWLLGGEGSWTGYSDDTLNEALTKSQLTSDPEETKELFLRCG